MKEQQNEITDIQNVKKGPMIAVLMAGAFMGIINETLLATALPTIMNDLNLQESTVQWLTTAFLLTNGVMIPISAFLIERFSTRKLFLTALSLFGAGTLIAALSFSFPMLLLGRIVQASGSGIMLPLMMTVILTIIPPERRGIAMGMAGIVISFGPAIGPTLSGWLLAYFEWRALFYVVLPLVLITIIIAALYMKNVTKLTYPKIDVPSVLMSSFGFGGLLFGFSTVAESGWESSSVWVSIIGGAIIITLFIRRQLKMKVPMLEFRVFKFNVFSLSLVITMVVLVSLIGAETLLPLYMQTVRGFTPLESGLMLLPGAIVMGIMSPITGYLFDKFGAKWLAITGLSVVTVTTFMFTNMTMETSFTYLTVVYAIRMFGLSFAMMPVMTAGLNQLPEEWNAHGSAMANTMQQVSASIGTAILITVMSIGTQNYEPDMNAIQGAADPETQMLNEAALNGYNMAFMGSTVLAFVALILSWFIKTKTMQTGEQVVKPKAKAASENG